jgi:RNA polymerase primary sigma factor
MKEGDTSSFAAGAQPPPEWAEYSDDQLLYFEPDNSQLAPPEIDEDAVEEIPDEAIRPEIVARVISTLRADAQRMEGRLHREDVQRQCFRRDLSIAECMEIESLLAKDDISIDSGDDLDFESGDSPTSSQQSTLLEKTAYLSDVEERELGRKIQLAARATAESSGSPDDYVLRLQQDAIAAKTRFVETNIRYVRKIAGRYGNKNHLSEEDIFQEGILGLMRAADKYDPELGFRFKTYATWWINQRIRRALDDQERTIRVPVHVAERVRAAKRASRIMQTRDGQEPSLDQIAETIGVETERLARMMWAMAETECVEADAPLQDKTDGSDATLFSFIQDSAALSQFDLAYREELKSFIQQNLTPKQSDVVLKRFGFSELGEQTLEEIGSKLGLTRERVRQIQDKAVARLARILKGMIRKKNGENQ